MRHGCLPASRVRRMRRQVARRLVALCLLVGFAAGLALVGPATPLLFLAPSLLVLAPLLAGRYPGERSLARLARARSRRPLARSPGSGADTAPSGRCRARARRPPARPIAGRSPAAAVGLTAATRAPARPHQTAEIPRRHPLFQRRISHAPVRIRRMLWALACTLTVLLAAPAAALAHAQLLGTVPQAGSTVDAQPPLVIFEFNEPVGFTLDAVRVYDAHGEEVDNSQVAHPAGAPSSSPSASSQVSRPGHTPRPTA